MTAHSKFILAGVMGWPIAHSRSPKIHNYWFAHYGLNGSYVPLAVQPGRLESALRALPALGFAGCNLTIPHKEAALSCLDVIDPAETRQKIVAGLALLATKREELPKRKHGNMPL